MGYFWEDFLKFEQDYKLFDLQDKDDTYIWDIVRFEVYIRLLWKGSGTHAVTTKKLSTRIYYWTARIFSFLPLYFARYTGKYLFFLCSRNVIDNKLFDQNAYSVLQLIKPNETVLIESYKSYNSLDTVYKGYRSYELLPFSFFKYFKKEPRYNFDNIVYLLNREFPANDINADDLQKIYRNFYLQKNVYISLLRRIGASVVFLTQNGIQKGLIAAAKEIGIKIYEFQHGIVDCGHIAYSYPNLNISDKIYLPHKILSLSDFWFNDCILPGVKIVPVGNDYFNIKKLPSPTKKQLLVISADVFGVALKDLLLNLLDNGDLSDYIINFKLHPNQFHDYDSFSRFFKGHSSVRIIKNEKSVSELLKECDTLFTIQSTAVYEGLQAGRKIIILKESSYARHAHIFDRENVYLIKTSQDFLEALTHEIKVSNDSNYFVSFNKDLFFSEFINE